MIVNVVDWILFGCIFDDETTVPLCTDLGRYSKLQQVYTKNNSDTVQMIKDIK